MKIEGPHIRPRPERITGIRHVFAAAAYSLGGARRLWKEAAFRHIVVAFLICLALLVGIGASWGQFSVFLILFFGLVAIRSLNTAIECIAGHLAHHWQAFARDAKDLGSLATICMLAANGVFIGMASFQHVATL